MTQNSTEARVQELMAKVASGEITMEQALSEAMVKTTKTVVDRVAAVADMNTLTELQVAYKKAAAKLSKAKSRAGEAYENDPSYLKYTKEFEAVQDKKNELYARAEASEDYVAGLIDIGAPDNAVVQEFMNSHRKIYTDKLMAYKTRKSLTNDQIHSFINSQSTTAPKALLSSLDKYKDGLSEAYLSRNQADQFVIKLNRMANAILAIKKTDK